MYNIFPATKQELSTHSFGELLTEISEDFHGFEESKPFSFEEGTIDVKLLDTYYDRFLTREYLDALEQKHGLEITSSRTRVTVKRDKKKLFSIIAGAGSRDKRAGGGKAGISFEAEIARDLAAPVEKRMHGKICQAILLKAEERHGPMKSFEVEQEGAKKQSRPVVFDGENIFVMDRNLEVHGEKLTDVTLKARDNSLYMSLKHGKQFFIANSSIRQYLKDEAKRVSIFDRLGLDYNKLAEFYGWG